jgi:hypothetical protein
MPHKSEAAIRLLNRSFGLYKGRNRCYTFLMKERIEKPLKQTALKRKALLEICHEEDE